MLRLILRGWPALLLTPTLLAGGCAHAPRPERRIYVIAEDWSGFGGSGSRDCDAEHVACFDRCWNSTPPLRSIKPGTGKHHEYCTEKCREAYMDCTQAAEQSARRPQPTTLRFSSMESAIDWLGEHKTEVLIGTVVVVAGVAFIISTGGSGALVLAPLAL
ncbi:hypothetical protein LXT21_05765 [Myxococcus sp. K38C18041901]|uniref:hypothetical protein n=1 Tax=Myxococcus guangdongensis TaxID=2906760 RepID=UPI0020A6EF6D|nr:hypothetical protein [Myxococcus guangdongensis]MCP3058268.1 hypothetical protein [Myxococcus guangdongensis]